MRAAIVVTIAVVLAVGSTLAQAQSTGTAPTATRDSLAPGQPAGLKQAQRGSSTLPVIIGAAAVAGGIALVAANNNDNSNPVAVTTNATTP